MFKRKRRRIPAPFLLSSVFTPASLPNLRSWFTDDFQYLDIVNPANLWWFNDLNAACSLYAFKSNGLVPVNLIQLNGHTVIDQQGLAGQFGIDSHGAVPPSTVDVMEQDNTSYTAFYLIRADLNTDLVCHYQLGFGSTQIFFQIKATNKLQWVCRGENAQAIILDTISNIANTGWHIIAVKVDYPNRTNTLYENGNTITGTNALIDFYTFAGGFYIASSASTGQTLNWDGGIGEFFYFTSLLSDANINKCGNYLAQKYALTWTNI